MASNELNNIVQGIQDFYDEINFLCDVFPPLPNEVWYLTNLPVIGLYLVTLPIRFLICYLASLLDINPFCFLYNLVPIVSLLTPLTTGSPYQCNCPNCTNATNCIDLSNPFAQYFQNCTPSVFNEVFCLIGAVLFTVLEILVSFVNPIIAFFLNKAVCIDVNPDLCFQNSPCQNG